MIEVPEPALPANLRLVALPAQIIALDSGVLVKRGAATIKIDGEGAAAAVEIIFQAGSQGATWETIVANFPAESREEAIALVTRLHERGFLAGGDAEPGNRTEDATDIFLWHFGDRKGNVAERLERTGIALVGVNAVSRQMAETLREAGAPFTVVDAPRLGGGLWSRPEPPSQPAISYKEWFEGMADRRFGCVAVCSEHGGQHQLRDWNRLCVGRGVAFLPVVLQDLSGFIGPLVIPGETACYECLRQRENSNLADAATVRAPEYVADEGVEVVAAHPVMARALGDLAGFELIKAFGIAAPFWNAGRLIEINFLESRMTSRKVLKIPRCQVCSPLNTISSVGLDADPFNAREE